MYGAVSRVKKCCLTIHSSLRTLSFTVWNLDNSELNFASIDSAPCSARRPNPTCIVLAHCSMHVIL